MKAVISSVWAEAAMVISLFADVLLMVSIISIGWCKPVDPDIDPQFEGIGLWRHCIQWKNFTNGDYHYACKELGQYNFPDWFTAVQVLMTLSFVGLIFTFTTIYMFACIDRFSKERKLLLIYGIFTLIFSSIGLAGVALFGEKIGTLKFKQYDLRVAWNFSVATVSISFHYLSVVLVTVSLIFGPRPDAMSSDTQQITSRTSPVSNSETPNVTGNTTGGAESRA